jgi:hypothetical protein
MVKLPSIKAVREKRGGIQDLQSIGDDEMLATS